MMTKHTLALVAVVALVGAVFALLPPREADRLYERVSVRRGTVADVLRETGILTPRDPVLVKTPIAGTVEWIIEDGAWVDENDRLFVINDDQAMREVTEARTKLLASQQELSLARMRRRQAERVEEQKIKAAERTLAYATSRYRILSTPPRGGRHLIEVHKKLVPLEDQTATVRLEYERAQDNYQEAQDVYLEHLDRWQAQKDSIFRAQAKIDEYTIRVESKVDETKPDQIKAHEEDKKQLVDAREQIEQLRQGLPTLEQVRDEARAKRDTAKEPRDKWLSELESRESTEKELYIELEIEKRGVELAQLQTDREIAQLTLEENQKKADEGRTAFAAGAISQLQLAKLESAVEIAKGELRILDEKIKIAGRPAPEEILTEARRELEQAEARAENARDVRDRSLEALEKEIELLEAQVERSAFEINRMTKDFEAVIEFGMRFLNKELEGLDETETQRKAEIQKELAELSEDLERVRANPPNVGKSSIGGTVRLIKRWGRPFHAGDDVKSKTMLMEILPPLNLEVKSAVNETKRKDVSQDMSVHITVPALGGRELTGAISLVSGVGKDKFANLGDWDEEVFAGVTQFESRIRLDDVFDDLRPGMTVVVEIKISEEEDVFYLPRGAVYRETDSFFVLTGSTTSPDRIDIQGRYYADDVFIVESGLTEDDSVLIERKKSR